MQCRPPQEKCCARVALSPWSLVFPESKGLVVVTSRQKDDRESTVPACCSPHDAQLLLPVLEKLRQGRTTLALSGTCRRPVGGACKHTVSFGPGLTGAYDDATGS